MSRVVFCPTCGWESPPLAVETAAFALSGPMRYCQDCGVAQRGAVLMQQRRVREIGQPLPDAPKVAGSMPLTVRSGAASPATATPDANAERLTVAERLYRKYGLGEQSK